MDLPYALADTIAKLVPNELGITIEKALNTNEFKKMYQEDPQIKKLIDMARRLEGLPRHTSMHAAELLSAVSQQMSMCLCQGHQMVLSQHNLR
jgi:DNA polymerase III alpha subunit